MRTLQKLAGAVIAWALVCLSLLPAAALAQAEASTARASEVKQLYAAQHVPFYVDDGTWNVDDSEGVQRTVVAGAYRLRIDAEETVAWSTSQLEAGDFYLEAATLHAGGPLNNEFGVIFRYQDDGNFYSYSISSDGYYRLDRKEAGEWSPLITWTESSAIQTGENSFNLLGLLVEGAQIALRVNDAPLATFTDESFASGAIGATAGTYDEAGVEIAYDDVTLWRIDPANLLEAPGQALAVPPAAPALEPVTIDAARIDATRAGAPLFSDRFRRDEGVWLTGEFENMAAAVRSGGLHLTVTAPQLVGWSSADVEAGDFLLEVDASIDDASMPGQVGVFFRKVDDGNYYYFAVEQGGNFGLWKKEDNAWSTLIDWTPASALTTDAVNRLGVWAEGSTIALFANGAPLAQVSDDSFEAGVIAVAAGTFAEPNLSAVFDDVELWALAE